MRHMNAILSCSTRSNIPGLFLPVCSGSPQKTVTGSTWWISEVRSEAPIFRIGNFGLKRPSSGDERGNLFVRIKVEIPKILSKKELALFEELAKLRKE